VKFIYIFKEVLLGPHPAYQDKFKIKSFFFKLLYKD